MKHWKRVRKVHVRKMKIILLFATMALFCWSETEACSGGGGDSGRIWIGGCWATLSRCTHWSNSLTEIMSKSCNDRCKDLGKSGGSCKLSTSNCPASNNPYQCQCY
eukprot:TCONS_00070344-protein